LLSFLISQERQALLCQNLTQKPVPVFLRSSDQDDVSVNPGGDLCIYPSYTETIQMSKVYFNISVVAGKYNFSEGYAGVRQCHNSISALLCPPNRKYTPQISAESGSAAICPYSNFTTRSATWKYRSSWLTAMIVFPSALKDGSRAS